MSGSVTCSCPFTSANVAGRYLRYSASPDWARFDGVTEEAEAFVSSRSDAAAAISSSSPVIGDPPHTHQSPRTLAAFRPWGGWRDNAVRGVTGQCSQPRDPDVPQPGHRWIRVSFPAEDSPSGLGRTLGKRVGGNPSRVRISYPPPSWPDSIARHVVRLLTCSPAAAAAAASLGPG